ncbi:MAG: amino acid--tRNA ligase-related protein [Termitinemataceae bacterium]
MDLELLKERSRIFKTVRAFFDDRDYLEVDTPILAPHLIPETCLEVFETRYVLPPGPVPKGSPESPSESDNTLDKNPANKRLASKAYWLVPSPELWMKRLLADHRHSIYQISKCFRNGESTGRIHSPEFTMLEYYTVGADYRSSINITEDLFRELLRSQYSGSIPTESSRKTMSSEWPKDLRPPFLRLTMEEAFAEWAGFPLYTVAQEGRDALAEKARNMGLPVPDTFELGDLYNLIFVHAVEPNLPRDTPVVLMDYPAFVPCLAKNVPGSLAKERWELYVRGIELANCYSEETDPEEIRNYFDAEGAAKRENALVPHAIDTDYWKTFIPRRSPAGTMQGFPACSGVAMGLDRLVMAFCGKSTIDSVLPFPMTEGY